MKKIRFGIVGGGWRARFFITAAQHLPEIFELTGVYLRNPEKAAALSAELNIPTFSSLEELAASNPEYVVVSVSRTASFDILCKVMELGMNILCETPPVWSFEDLTKLWEAAKKYGTKFQVAEQYFARPLMAAHLKVVELGLLGDVTYAAESYCHGYHGTNMLRRYLGVGMQNCEISGKALTIPTIQTGARGGDFTPDRYVLKNATRDLVTFCFESGKNGIYDFSGDQYHSTIRHNRVHLMGERGELIDNNVWWLTEDGLPASGMLDRKDLGINCNLDGYCLQDIMLGERRLYWNKYMPARLADDEIAVAYCMENMGLYVRGEAEPCYPLAEALQDTYLALCMEKALATGETVKTETQVWAK